MKRLISRTSAALAVAITALALSSPARAEGPAGAAAAPPPPPGPVVTRDVITYEESMPNGQLIGSGLTMFGISYVPSVVVAAVSSLPADKALYIPVAGPWINLANRDTYCAQGRCYGDAPNKALLIIGGVFQGLGALQVVGGFLVPTTRTVTRTAGVHVLPNISTSQVGITAIGTF